jgi:hypothetical protein
LFAKRVVPGANLQHAVEPQLGSSFPRLAGPLYLKIQVHSAVISRPLRVSSPLLSLNRPSLSAGLDFPGFLALQRNPRASAMVKQAVRDPPRLRPRAFSTPRRFSHARVPRPCFVPQPFLSFSLRVFPSQESPRSLHRAEAPLVRAHLSRGCLLPCGYPPPC